MTSNLPKDEEAERMLLACAMLDGPDVITNALARGINEESFYRREYGELFTLMTQMVQRGECTEQDAVCMRLVSTAQLERFGGYPGITQITQGVPTTLYAKEVIKKVAEMATRRTILRTMVETAEKASQDQTRSAAELLEDSMKGLAKANPAQPQDTWTDACRAAEAFLNKHTDPDRANEEDEDALSFGFHGMDEVFGPMRMGQMVVLAARPSVGKSSLARQIAYHAAIRMKEPVVFASLEVLGRSLALNMAQTISGVPIKSLSPKLPASSKEEFTKALAEIHAPTLEMIAGSNINLAGIQAKAQVMRSKGNPIRLLVIDYLQLMPDAAPDRGETRAASVGKVSRALKAFALAHNCVVLVLSQLNRDSAKDGREPALYDLRESGDIEQDADKVIILHRPTENPLTKKPQSETTPVKELPSYYISAIQAKGRDDGTGIVGLQFRRKITRFETPTKENAA